MIWLYIQAKLGQENIQVRIDVYNSQLFGTLQSFKSDCLVVSLVHQMRIMSEHVDVFTAPALRLKDA